MKSFIDNNIKSDLEYSKNIIDNIFQGKSDQPVPQMKINENEKNEMRDISEAAAQIAGMPTMMLKRVNPIERTIPEESPLINQCLSVLDNKQVPDALAEKVLTIIEKMEKYQDFLLRFLKKYN